MRGLFCVNLLTQIRWSEAQRIVIFTVPRRLLKFYKLSTLYFLFSSLQILKDDAFVLRWCIFSMKRRSDAKTWKIQMSILKLKIRKLINDSDSSGRAHQLMTRETVLGTSMQSFLLYLPKENWSRCTAYHHCEYFFVCFCWWLCNHKFYIIILLEVYFKWILLKCSCWYFIASLIIMQTLQTMQTYIYIYIYNPWLHTHDYTPWLPQFKN